MGSRPARQGATGAVRHLDGGQWSIDALVQLAGDERRLGRCVAAVVATDAGPSWTHQAPGNLFGQRTEEFRSSISTVSLQSQLILQSWHDLTRSVMVQPGCLVPTKPAGAPATALCRMVDAEVLLDRSRDQLLQLGVRQGGGPDFFPAAPPDSGTTRPTATGSGGGARRSSSAPGNRPGPPPPWPAGNILRSGAPPWTPGPVLRAGSPGGHSINSSQTCMSGSLDARGSRTATPPAPCPPSPSAPGRDASTPRSPADPSRRRGPRSWSRRRPRPPRGGDPVARTGSWDGGRAPRIPVVPRRGRGPACSTAPPASNARRAPAISGENPTTGPSHHPPRSKRAAAVNLARRASPTPGRGGCGT